MTKPTEKEFKEVVKSILLKKMDKPLNPCTEYPSTRQLNQKFKLEKKPK